MTLCHREEWIGSLVTDSVELVSLVVLSGGHSFDPDPLHGLDTCSLACTFLILLSKVISLSLLKCPFGKMQPP